MPPRGRGRGRGGSAASMPARQDAPADQPATAPTIDITSSTDVSRSSTPNTTESTRGASSRRGSTRAKKSFAPKFTGRRSKAERDALEQQTKDREAQRMREKDRENKAIMAERRLDSQNRRPNPKNQGRGGYTGISLGPFSLGSASQERRKASSSFTSGSRATRVKREPGEYGGGGASRGSGGNAEDGGDVSSDNDEADFPRKNIDLIELSSDDEDAGSAERKERSSRNHAATTLPVRIGRKEHQERVFGINTEASSTGSKALEGGESSNATIKVEGADGSRKGKGKAKDVEITDVRLTYKGMWQDDGEKQVQVKPEPMSEDEDGAVPFGLSDGPPQAADKQPPASPETKKELKGRRPAIAQPALQTEEDKQEWGRFLTNRLAMRAELGPDEKDPVTDSVTESTGEIKADADDASKQKQSVRDNNVYIFQLPPTIPDLLVPGIKEEPSEPSEADKTPLQPAPAAPPSKTPIKVEDIPTKYQYTHGPRVASGIAGKIRVRESGRTSLIWGGTNFELNPGHQATFLQEAASVNIVPAKERVVPEDGGDASSFGRVKGKFVVVPDWVAML